MRPPSELPHGWGSIIAFLDGPRNCIGWRLGKTLLPCFFKRPIITNFFNIIALLEIKIIVATLIRSIEFFDTGAKVVLKTSPTLQPVVEGEAGVLPLRLKLLHS